MKIWAAIDLLGGKVVRLAEGKLENAVVYSDDPVKIARLWRDEGAHGLHVVDLDAAFGQGHNRDLILEIVAAAEGIDVQVGGGVRTLEDAQGLIRAGVRRVIVGSVLIRAPEVFHTMCEKYPGRVLAGLDARDREVRVSGWTEGSAVGIEDAVLRALAFGAAGAVVTDIARDGMMKGPNVDLLKEVVDDLPKGFEIIASGGISTTDDLVVLKVIGGVSGSIVGTALYEGRIELPTARARLEGRRVGAA